MLSIYFLYTFYRGSRRSGYWRDTHDVHRNGCSGGCRNSYCGSRRGTIVVTMLAAVAVAVGVLRAVVVVMARGVHFVVQRAVRAR